ncbi:hypothetical protein SBA7_820031 [Candidatus Sulfotelmatobacter sp. SbA7]|nr:hypothetical protein SBA7_820031 [Candidatus Sulfotelmatobacter sp. SbA7]
MMRHHDHRRRRSPTPSLLHNRPQRWPVQVVEMRVRDQHQVNGWQIAQLYARLSQALQHEQPARKIGIDNYILPAHLDEETGVANESYSQFSVAYQFGLMSLPGAGSHGGVLHQPPEGPGTLAKDGVLETGLQHQYASNLTRFGYNRFPGAGSKILTAPGYLDSSDVGVVVSIL